ncbi:MAG TPA: ABC transporter substrate-binding protein [Usitatibacter sp.]|jgi:peptide/nickel transport system substrate-binding protein|nr:ABC transporter substrate-binding protein [Usitatibacter sp.]
MRWISLVVAGLVWAAGAHAQNLVLGTKLELNTLDPHFFSAFPTNSSMEYFYDKLVDYDRDLRIRPSLAVSWKVLDERTWRFRLRPGVTFHDGSPFTVDDVIFTIERIPGVPNSPNSFVQFTRGIESLRKADDLTLDIVTRGPYPQLLSDLANIFIVSARAAKGATTADFNSGKAVVGTGPYRLVEWVNGERLVVERNEKYWGARPAWARVTERVIAKDPSRLAALLAGQVDAIDAVPIADLERLRREGRFALFRGPAALVHYVALDSSRDVSPFVTAKDGRPLAANPLKDRRVRKALSLAINRDAIVRRVMEGSALPASQMLSATFPSASHSLEPDPYDPSRAQALLREAGWGDGFRIVLHSTGDRYPSDASIAQAIAQMWTRIGLKAEVEALPGAVFFTRASKQEFSAFTAQYGAEDSMNSLRALVATSDPARGYGTANRTRYSNPGVDRLLADALATFDDAERQRKLERAIDAAMADTPLIPVFYPIHEFAAKKGLIVTPRAQRRFNALMVTPAKG